MMLMQQFQVEEASLIFLLRYCYVIRAAIINRWGQIYLLPRGVQLLIKVQNQCSYICIIARISTHPIIIILLVCSNHFIYIYHVFQGAINIQTACVNDDLTTIRAAIVAIINQQSSMCVCVCENVCILCACVNLCGHIQPGVHTLGRGHMNESPPPKHTIVNPNTYIHAYLLF